MHTKLLRLLNCFEHRLYCENNALMIQLGKYSDARHLIMHCVDDIISSLCLFNLDYGEVWYSEYEHPFRVDREMLKVRSFLPCPAFQPELSTKEVFMSEILQAPEVKYVFTGVCRLTEAFIPHIDRIVSHPDDDTIISRCTDNKQIIANPKHIQVMGITGEQAVTINTADYWLSSHMEELQKKYRDLGSTEFEHTFDCSNYIVKTNPEAPWIRKTARYRIFDDGFGILYRVGQTIDIQDIPTPANVH